MGACGQPIVSVEEEDAAIASHILESESWSTAESVGEDLVDVAGPESEDWCAVTQMDSVQQACEPTPANPVQTLPNTV